MTTTLLENCRIPPPQEVAAEVSLPLTFFDIPLVHFHPIQRFFFYHHPCPRDHLLDTIIPKIKESLSLTLKHYVPLAGNLLYPIDTESKKPIIRYMPGDSVSLTIVESTKCLENLIFDFARDDDQFYDFVPLLPPVKDEIEIWASIQKLGGDKEFFITQGESLPIFDRSIIIDPQGIDDKYWDLVKETPLKTATIPLPTGRVRTTHILNRNDLTKLRKWLVTKNPGLGQVATFVVLAAYVWTCFVKSGEDVEDDERTKNMAMKVNDYGTQNDGMLQMLSGFNKEFFDITQAEVCGSSINPYNVDFGLGLPRKMEVVSIDGEKYSMSLCKSRFYEGGFEVGLSLPKQRMDKFDDIFSDGLSTMTTTLLENCQIPPPPQGVAAEMYLPLTFFDIPWPRLHGYSEKWPRAVSSTPGIRIRVRYAWDTRTVRHLEYPN
ncbi:hypothetical protein RD792_007476 [Penstemon davidsonii]|uniref:Uncharacterized protein n=1 Tax=Penstemon davidsonii TaxID=160366 RepID=A0ABR0D6K5_9LAMI|nr:hypothetical protein RD792_007476 [Penstemon davidsonii]